MSPDPVVDYDDVDNIYVRLHGMKEVATKLVEHGNRIADCLGRINTVLRELEYNWAGPTQQEAEHFNDQWLQLGKSLLGSKENPSEGVLNAIVEGIENARENYTKADGGITDEWVNFMKHMGGVGGGEPKNENIPERIPDDRLDTNMSAITADYPPFNKP